MDERAKTDKSVDHRVLKFAQLIFFFPHFQNRNHRPPSVSATMDEAQVKRRVRRSESGSRLASVTESGSASLVITSGGERSSRSSSRRASSTSSGLPAPLLATPPRSASDPISPRPSVAGLSSGRALPAAEEQLPVCLRLDESTARSSFQVGFDQKITFLVKQIIRSSSSTMRHPLEPLDSLTLACSHVLNLDRLSLFHRRAD